jgi:hypothetical protein
VIAATNEWLVITADVDNQSGTAYVPDLTLGMAVGAITATFDINQSRGSDVDEADGAALFFGAFADNTTVVQDGFGLVSGLRLRFHIENNGLGDGPDEAISIFYNNSEVFTTQVDLTTDTLELRNVSLSVDPTGALYVSYNGSPVTNGSGSIAGWAPEAGWQFALAGRTGGRNAFQYFDNVDLSATAIPEPSEALLLSLAGGLLMVRRRRA